MKNLFLFLSFLVAVLSSCEANRPQKNCTTYEELPDPNPPGSGWDSLSSAGLNASFGSIDVRYEKSSVPAIPQGTMSWKGIAWKGEQVSAQVVLWTNRDLRQVEFEMSDLRSGDKSVLSSSIVRTHFVRYVMTDEFAGGCGYRKPENFKSSLSADVLDNLDCIDMKSNTARPVWITIAVPADAVPGAYKGELTVYAKDGEKQVSRKFYLDLEVLNRTLSPAKEWTFHLDLWQHPGAVARWYKIPVWSDEHFEKMRPLMQRLANAGQKVITATLNKDPWNGQCYDRYADMIFWTKKADGSWKYDYSNFDKWVQFMMDLGVRSQINCYSMVPWNNELHYFDEAKNDTVTVQAEPGTPVFETMWKPFLADFKEHLKSKSWLEITNIAMDERSPKVMKATLGFLQKEAPELGVALSDNHKSYKEYPFLKEISVAYGAIVEPQDMAYRQEHDLNTIYYVCCSDKFPNAFSFSPPAESAYNIWYAVAAGFDGFSRWAYNSWVENPLLDTRFRSWPAGDTNYIYPEDRSSIRFERLIEGMQSAEKFRLLCEEFSKKDDVVNKAKLDRLNNYLAKFNVLPQPAESADVLVSGMERLLNELAR